MTRSRHASQRGARHARRLGLLALPLLVFGACSGRELSLGGDPVALSVGATSGASAGSAGNGGGPVVAGGGPGTGGSVTAGNGGTIVFAGGGGASEEGGSGGGGATAAAGGADDNPYPPVTWQNGQGYRDVCPEHDDTSGFTCWHHDAGNGTTCGRDGSPTCNACSCAIPCEESADCPTGVLGEPAGCFGAATNLKSCFLVCDSEPCPLGMACSDYPGASDRVCVWVDQPVSMGQPK